MKILDFIKSLFKRNKTKLLEETNEMNQDIEKTNETKNQFNENNKVKLEELGKNEKTKSEKVIMLLESIGCDKDVFKRINNFEDVDLQKMKDNLMLFTTLGFTKLEMHMMLRK